MTAPLSPLLFVVAQVVVAGASPPPEATTAPEAAAFSDVPVAAAPGVRQHRTLRPEKRGTHELKDPAGWPDEPPSPGGAGQLDAERFDAVVIAMCREASRYTNAAEVARLVREVSAETGADPFLMAALAYRQGRCQPGVSTISGVGLLQIEPGMFRRGAPLPFPQQDLARDRLLDPAHNLRVGAALLKMWANHQEIDRAVGSTPHRTAVAHLVWGDHVWGATAEDRVLAARRRLIERYAEPPAAVRPSSLALPIVSPLEGAPRLGTSGPGADREDGRRAHRGVDVDAAVGEPVRAVADGVVQFAGADLPGRAPARWLLPRQVRRWRSRHLGPGGLFVRIVHEGGVRTGYFHLSSFCVEAGQTVKAGDLIGTVGRTGIKVSASHLHFEVHKDGELGDPVAFLSAFVLPPDATVTHDRAMAEKKQRLARERRHRRRARVS